MVKKPWPPYRRRTLGSDADVGGPCHHHRAIEPTLQLHLQQSSCTRRQVIRIAATIPVGAPCILAASRSVYPPSGPRGETPPAEVLPLAGGV
jgi:hypothetical protein